MYDGDYKPARRVLEVVMLSPHADQSPSKFFGLLALQRTQPAERGPAPNRARFIVIRIGEFLAENAFPFRVLQTRSARSTMARPAALNGARRLAVEVSPSYTGPLRQLLI